MFTTEYDQYIFLDPIVEVFMKVFHLNEEMMRLAIVLIGQYPLAWLLRYKINTTEGRHTFALVTGLILSFFTFKWDALHFFFSSLGVYLIAKFIPNRQAPYVSFIWCMAYLSYGHWWRYQYQYLMYTVNWATTQMLLTIKITAFAWSYHDGQKPENQVVPALRPLAIKSLPSLKVFFSYVFFFPGFNTGPVGFFNEYTSFMDRSIFAQEPDGKIPPTEVAALKRFALSFIGIFGFYLTKLYPEAWLVTDEYLNKPFWYRIGYLLLSVDLGFTKYYFAWFNGEASTTLVGYSYNGRDPKTGEVKWDRVNILNFVAFYTGRDRRTIPVEWNICSGKWLRYYIFFRLPTSMQQHGVLVTHVVSAFWHGFYPGYYYFFLTHWWFHRVDELFDKNVLAKYVYEYQGRERKIRNVFYHRLYLVLGTIHFWVGLKYWVAPFRVMSLYGGWRVWQSWYFIPHIFLAVLHIYFTLFGSKDEKKPATVVSSKQSPVPVKAE